MTVQRGGSTVEILLVTPPILWFVFTAMQLAELIETRSVVVLAATEAVRHGALHHGDIDLMHTRFRLRTQILNGTTDDIRSADDRDDPEVRHSNTEIRVLSPPPSAFDDWGYDRDTGDGRFISSHHLAHHDEAVQGARSGLSLREANLLVVETVFLSEVRMPWAAPLLIAWLDRTAARDDTSIFLQGGRVAFRVIASALMQSDAHDRVLYADPTLPRPPSGIDHPDPAIPDGEVPVANIPNGSLPPPPGTIDPAPAPPDAPSLPNPGDSVDEPVVTRPETPIDDDTSSDCRPATEPATADDYHGLPSALPLPGSLGELASIAMSRAERGERRSRNGSGVAGAAGTASDGPSSGAGRAVSR